MAKVRIGFSTAFELENELVGIGTDNPTNTLQALGNIKSTDAKAVGVSTFTTFDGFTDTKLRLEGSAGTKQHTTSGEIIIEGEVTVSSGTTYTSGPKNLTVTNKFTLPKKTTYAPTVGSMRFNENLAALEFYTGTEWRAVNSRIDMGNRGRGIFGGGQPAIGAGYIDPIQYIQIQSKGNSQYFGELASTGHGAANVSCCSSSIRGLFMGGSSPNTNYLNVIEYINIASSGNGINFGDLTQRVSYTASCSSSTRGCNMGGYVGTPHPAAHHTNTISYVEIMTLGDALDFGDLQVKTYSPAGGSNGTRGMYAAGYTQSSVINSFNIASAGTNASNFGDLIERRYGPSGSSNRTRMIVAGGQNDAVATKSIEFITMASEGNGIDFGNMSVGKVRGCSVADQTRCVFATGDEHPGPAATNIIEFILIASGGSTEDFGDMMTETQYAMGSCSDSHGGLGGF